jgi:hypothetical protein
MWTTAVGPSARARGARRDSWVGATTAVVSDHSEKVRVQAALVLGRVGDDRAVPFLIRALSDPSTLVRAMAAKSLGHIADGDSRPSLEVATRDPSPMVRRHAAAALQTLAERQATSGITVQSMGDKTRKASGELRQRMRDFVAAEVRGFGKLGAGGYTVDGAIKVLSISNQSDPVEVKCGVELVLSTAGQSIVMMTSGEAIVQRQRRHFRLGMQPAMEIEALQHAVRGASEELRQHFATNVP